MIIQKEGPRYIQTVKELKDAVENYPDNMQIVGPFGIGKFIELKTVGTQHTKDFDRITVDILDEDKIGIRSIFT